MFEALFKGWVGELKTKATQKLFLDSKQYHIFNNVIIPREEGTTQIDHVIVSKYGIFVVETKDRSGWIFGSETDSQWIQDIFGKKVRFQNPLRQNYLHSKTLAEFLGIEHNKIHSLIVFWGDCEFKTRIPENVVKGVFELTNYIKSKKQILLTDNEVDRICAQVRTTKDNTSILQDVQHAYTLYKRYASTSICPKCGGKLLVRNSTRGRFLGCEHYPRCRYTKEL
jgi:restriction system protein